MEFSNIFSEILKHGLGQHIYYLFIGGNNIESYFSLIYHVPDIVVFDIDILGIVMTH
jgi:hypothetical protein